MEVNGDQNVDLNSQLGIIVATHPHLQLKQNSIPSPPPSLNFVVHPCLSFARFCESRISSNNQIITITEVRKKTKSYSSWCGKVYKCLFYTHLYEIGNSHFILFLD